jgi:hypothetical protein
VRVPAPATIPADLRERELGGVARIEGGARTSVAPREVERARVRPDVADRWAIESAE